VRLFRRQVIWWGSILPLVLMKRRQIVSGVVTLS
jgi:aromatic ring-opening dioxygenase LigB subunit